MGLNINKAPQQVKESKVLRAPSSKIRVIKPEKGVYRPVVNICLMGIPGTGKTRAIAQAIELGAKVVMINTDTGQSGEETILSYLRTAGKEDLFYSNLIIIRVDDDDELSDFLAKPEKSFPEIYEFDPDILVWEGFSNWQQTKLYSKVGELYRETVEIANENSSKEKSVSTQRAEGLQLEMQDWGKIRNASIQRLEEFLNLNNKVTGREWVHLVTIHEAVETKMLKQENAPPVAMEQLSGRPLIQGAAKNLIGGGFTLSLRCREERGKYYYELSTTKTMGMSKNRGIALPEKFDADFVKVIDAIESSYNITLFKRG